MDKNELPFEIYEEFDFEDFCKDCPYLRFETECEYEKPISIMSENTIRIEHSCPHIQICRRIKNICKQGE